MKDNKLFTYHHKPFSLEINPNTGLREGYNGDELIELPEEKLQQEVKK